MAYFKFVSCILSAVSEEISKKNPSVRIFGFLAEILMCVPPETERNSKQEIMNTR